MELTFTKKEKLAGVFIIGTAILLLATVIIIGRGKDWFKDYVTYHTIFSESYNLKENAAVKLLNADIGKVKKITIEGNKVRVEMAILAEYAHRIRKDSVATVESPTLIGSEFISIKPGSPDTDLLPEKGEIPSQPRRSLADIAREFEIEKTAKMLISAIQNFTEVVAMLRDPEGPLFTIFDRVNHTLASIDRMILDIEAGRGTLGSIITSRQLIDEVHEKLDKLDPILGNITAATAKAPPAVDLINENLEGLKRLQTKLGPILDSMTLTTAKAPGTMDLIRDNLVLLKALQQELSPRITEAQRLIAVLESSMQSVRTILSHVEAGSPDIPVILKDTKATLHEVRVALGNLDKILLSLQGSFLIRGNLPPSPAGGNIEANPRP